MLAYIEKEHYHIDKNIANIGFVWHSDISFQPNEPTSVLYGTQIFHFNPMKHLSLEEDTAKHIHFPIHSQEINAH